MLQSLSDMLSWRVRTADKTAALSDILFDPDSRQMTYLSLRPGGVSGRQVLASASRLGKTDAHAREVELRITPEELETAPSWGGDADELSALLTAMPPLVVGPFGATHAPLAMAAFAGEGGEDEADMPPDPRAEEALDRMAEPPDLVIAEQELPDMSGLELTRQLALMQPGLPVILLTPEPASLSVAGREAGARAVLQKPAQRRALLAALETALEPPQSGAGAEVQRPVPAFRHRPVTGANPRPDPAERPVARPAPRPLDVLLAEDNRTNQLVFRKMVQKLGQPLRLRFADNGIEAVRAYREQRPDLIFMDISMPHMDGREATREIRALEAGGPRVPIIAVTAHAMTGDREGVIEAGLDDYLTKPLRKAELAALLDKWTSAVAQAP